MRKATSRQPPCQATGPHPVAPAQPRRTLGTHTSRNVPQRIISRVQGAPAAVGLQRGDTVVPAAASVSVSASGSPTAGVATSTSSAAQQDENAREWEEEMEELLKLVALLPPSVRMHVEQHPQMPELLEVVMDLGRPPLARFPDGDVRLGDGVVTVEDLEVAVKQVGEFGGDNRAGIDRTLHRISCIRNRSGRIIGLTCRVGRAIKGSARLVSDLVTSGASILFLGRPGVGKTTVIREVSRALADELHKRVVIVDTSNEIGGDGDIPHEGIGRARRIQVPHPDQQHRVMIEAVENHMPQVVVIDEIGTEAECVAARTIAQRGVQLVATAHGNELENVVKNPSLADLVGGIQSVTLGDEEAKRRGVQKSILERAGPPTFDVAVEMLDRTRWRIHLDTAQAVDLLLAGGSPGGQVRERADDGSIFKYTHDPALSSTMARAPKDYAASGGAGNGNGGAGLSAKAAKAAAAAALAAQEAMAAAAANSSGLPRGLGAASSRSGSPSESRSVASAATSNSSSGASVAAAVAATATSSGSSSRVSSSSSSLDVGSMADLEADEAAMLAQGVGAELGGSGSFVKRSVLGSIEAAAEAAEQLLEDDGVPTQKGARRLANRQALMGVQPAGVVLRLFPFELDADKLWEVMSAMGLTQKVLIVRRVAQADAVLGLRAKVKTDAALRTAAKASRVPIYAIKATGTSNLVRALRTLLGIDPSAGGVFTRASAGEEQSDLQQSGSSTAGQGPAGEVELSDSAGQPAVSGASLRAEMDIASVRQQRQASAYEEPHTTSTVTVAVAAADATAVASATATAAASMPRLGASQQQQPAATPLGSGTQASYRLMREALEEARAACENLVAPLGQPVELLPRALHILQAQQQVVEEHQLGWQLLGSGADLRLKVLPRSSH